ncbi:MAG: universal stress protein [Anaerolineae bacterium]|nr:MAG: universal stress protein [Anaerolineae bacterium]
MNALVYIDQKRKEYPALDFLNRLAQSVAVSVTLLYVLLPEESQQQGEEILQRAARQLVSAPVNLLIRWGDPINVLLSEAHRDRFDLLVLQSGVRRRNMPRLEPLDQILTHSMYPMVLILRGKDRPGRRILACTAGWEERLEVTRAAALLARSLEASVTLLHVAAGTVPVMFTGLPALEESLSDVLQTDTVIARHLREAAKILAASDVEAELELRRGAPVDEILREVKLGQYDLVVIGRSRVTNGLKELLMGDVMQRLVSRVPVSLLVVGEGALE